MLQVEGLEHNTYRSRNGGYVIVTEGEHYDIPGLGKVLWNTRQLVVAQIQGYKVTDSEYTTWHPWIFNIIMVGIQYLHMNI